MVAVGHVDVNAVSFSLPDGRRLLDEVTFRVGDGSRTALVGPNGAGKTTLLRIVAGDLAAHEGAVTRTGGLGVMRQFIGSVRDGTTVRDLLVSVSPPALRDAVHAVDAAELAMMEADDQPTQMRYAHALADYADAGGYEAETLWDTVTVAALGVPYEACRWREVRTLSGGEQKRLVLEALLRGPDEVLLLDEPDNYLDVPGKQWLEERLVASTKTVLLVSHDRELLDRVSTRVAALEPGAAGSSLWVHPGSFGTWHDARRARFERLDELRRRWDEEHAKLKALVLMYKTKSAFNDGLASRYQAAQTRLRKFEEAGPPQERPREQNVTMRLRGGRTGKRVVVADAARAHRPDAAVRRRAVVRGPGGGAGLQRVRQVALPAAAGRRRLGPRPRAPSGGRRAGRAGDPHRVGAAGRARAAGVVRADAHPS